MGKQSKLSKQQFAAFIPRSIEEHVANGGDYRDFEGYGDNPRYSPEKYPDYVPPKSSNEFLKYTHDYFNK